MKKLGLLVMPLMTISFLASCNKGGGGGEQFTVTFDTVGGSYIESQKVSSGAKAIKPSDPTKEQTDFYTFDFKDWQLDGVIYDFNTPVTKDITLKATYDKKARHYIANAINDNNLTFTTTNDEPLKNIGIVAGQNFTFKVKADSQNYVVPSILNISVKGMEPLANGYRVESPGNAESKVTINGPKVIGDVIISGTAVDNDKFNYKVSSHYGLTVTEGTSGTRLKTSGLTLTFESGGTGSTIPKAENIYIQFDNVPGVEGGKAWISPADDGADTEYCSYDENSGKLTIKANHILNSIDIKARANNYKLLNKLTWEEINELSITGAAPYVFYLGEEKTIVLSQGGVEQDFSHTVRIIAFNHDYSELPDDGSEPDSNKVLGITFEFVNLITNFNGAAATTIWDTSNNNFDYRKSTLNRFLNYNVLNMLPDDLKTVIKPVDKKVGVSTDEGKSYNAISFDGDTYPYPYLFPLAHDEMTNHISGVVTNEGSKYQYYTRHPEQADRIKKTVKGNSNYYWLRSPYEYGSNDVWYINCDGFQSHTVCSSILDVAPAFCI